MWRFCLTRAVGGGRDRRQVDKFRDRDLYEKLQKTLLFIDNFTVKNVMWWEATEKNQENESQCQM